MSTDINGDSGSGAPRERVDDDPAARPHVRPATESHGTLRWTAGPVAPTNGHVIPVPSPIPAAESGTPGSSAVSPLHAGVVTRLLAAAVDTVVVVVLAALLDLAAAGARFVWSPIDFRWPRPTWSVAVGVLLLVAVVYLTAGWAMAGRTYGAKLLGLRVLSSRHRLLGWARSGLRAVLSVIWPVGLLWCAISRARLSVADLVVRSVVVYDTQPYVEIGTGEPPSAPPRAS